MTIRIYLRRSDERKQAGSIETQRAHCDAMAAARYPGAEIVYYVDGEGRHCRDEMESHTEWHRLLIAIVPGDVVMVYERSRIGADLEYPLAVRDVGTRGATLIIASTGETAKMVGGISDIMEIIHGLQSKEEVTKIRTRTRDGLRRRAADGHSAHFLGYGYRSVKIDPLADKSEKRDEIDPGQAAIVRRICEEHAAGDGYVMIAKRLNAEGVRGPSRGASRNGRTVRPVWTGEAIAKMLRAPIYRGELRYAGTVYQRPELAIIDSELATRVDGERSARTRQGRPRHVVHPIAGLGRCSECRGAICSHSTGSGRTNYVCDRRRRIGDCNVAVRVRVEAVEAAIVAGLAAQVLDDAMTAQILKHLRCAIDSEIARAAAATGIDAGALRTELADAQARKRRALALAMATDDGDVLALAKAATADVRAIELQIAAAERPAIDEVTARRIEADAAERRRNLRAEVADRAQMRGALQRIFPGGLRFIPDGDGWIITGDACPVHLPLERPTEQEMYTIPFRVRAAA